VLGKMTKSRFSVSVLSLLLAACSGAAHPQASAVASAASCRAGSIRGDAELARYAHCSSIDGDLRVSDVTTLKPLAALKEVQGALVIGPTRELSTLSGLEQLERVQHLVLERNRALISAHALNGLVQAEHVRISNNPLLSKSFGFFEALPVRDSKLELGHNVGLEAEGMKIVREAKAGRAIASL
jgi:hypothetical protein